MSAGDDGPLSLSLGMGWTERFTYRNLNLVYDGSIPLQFGMAGCLLAATEYPLSDHLSLRGGLGYLGYEKNLWVNPGTSTAGITGLSPGAPSLTAQYPFVTIGARAYVANPGSPSPRPYVEVAPAFWFSRWKEEYTTHYDLDGNPVPPRVEQDAFRALEPGFIAGAGLLGPLLGRTKLDVGVRYFFSAGLGQHHLGQVSSGGFEGLRQFALIVGIQRSL